jgi:hypothetical protein
MEIWDWYDLDAIMDNPCWNYTLMNDLNSTTPGYEELAGPIANGGRGWTPMGDSLGERAFPFKGTFDGQGYEIRDLFVYRIDPFELQELGLFGYSGGIIKNIGVVNATVVGGATFVGALVGDNWGTVSNSYASGYVSNSEDYGGVGGLVGHNWHSYGSVINSYSAASVSGIRNVGGLVGANGGTVNNSYSTGSVTGNSSVGGLVGRNDGDVSNSFWDAETSGLNFSAGGTGKNTTEMQSIATFSDAGWNIVAVVLNETNPAYIWNIVNNITYPFLTWQS